MAQDVNKVLLLILDGWGYNPETKGNAVKAADTPCMDSLLETCPNTLLNASSVFVGLPEGIMGNSEVGHENIGAGRINKQKLTMISDMVRSGEFFENQVLQDAVAHAKNNNSRIHFMGLISEGDVHAHLGHLDALVELAQQAGLTREQIVLQAISDGRDDPPRVAEHLMKRYEPKLKIATVSGRYWAMDRDSNWDRLERYIDCVVGGKGERASSASEAIVRGYQFAEEGKNPAGLSDEFILPTIIDKSALIQDNDAVVFFNFRPDRARQISRRLGMQHGAKLADPMDVESASGEGLKNLRYVCFTDYSSDLDLSVAFSEDSLPSQEMNNGLGQYISDLGFNQFRIAETEKFNHVTSFFNMRRKEALPNEDRCLIPSPKVATYDLQPEMSLPEVTKSLLGAMSNKDKDYKLIVCNFANPDMVGHTGVWDAVLQALQEVDSSVGQVLECAKQEGYIVLITADHGNADQMLDLDDGAEETRTAHSCNPVPLILVNADPELRLRNLDLEELADSSDVYRSLSLANIAPTILDLMGLAKPKEMLAGSLLEKVSITL